MKEPRENPWVLSCVGEGRQDGGEASSRADRRGEVLNDRMERIPLTMR